MCDVMRGAELHLHCMGEWSPPIEESGSKVIKQAHCPCTCTWVIRLNLFSLPISIWKPASLGMDMLFTPMNV